MPKLIKSTPKYRKDKGSGQAVVVLDAHKFYLGPHRTKASLAEYDRLITEWLANGRRLPQSDDATIAEMLVEYWRFAKRHYRKDGQPTTEIGNIKSALRPLKALYAKLPVREFGPLKLKALQTLLVNGYTAADGAPVRGVARRTVNARIGAIKRVFRWAVSQEMAPPALAHALDTVRGLQVGRTDARETEPVEPVDDSTVEATLPHLPLVVADLVRFQRLTGCRPGEACAVRPCDVDRSTEVWTYRPESHKTQHHGRDRVILIGPRSQTVLFPYLLREPQAYCFSPTDSEKKRKAQLRANRKTPVQPSQFDRRKRRPKVRPTDRYTKDSYNRAVHRACAKAGVAPWSPNRLRHTAATSIRKQFGLEAAQVMLGHSRADVTQVYAERDSALGFKVSLAIG